MIISPKIEKTFIQLELDFSGVIKNILSGTFAKKEFKINDSIYETCSFLEATLDALILNKEFEMDGMVITSSNKEFNIDIELLKNEDSITVTILDRTSTYKYITKLNQNRNDIFLVKSKLDKQNKELDTLKKRAEKLNKEKSRFLAIMSHEIRNPLNSILGFADLIFSNVKNPEIKKYAESLVISGKNLKVIVNDILDFSRIEAGKLDLSETPISIKEIVENVINNFKLHNSKSHIKLSSAISDEIPESVIGDSVRISQILINLIGNSLKFTNDGSITIEVDVQSIKKNKVILSFKVKDTGRGMTPKQLGKIFKEYEQTDIDDNRVFGGAGLGLSIVKLLTESMKGKVIVDSELHIGTTFTINIPFEKPLETKKVVETKVNDTSKVNGLEILYADDDEFNRMIAVHLLKKMGAKTTIVNDGLEAFNKLKEQKFDLVLLDIHMPHMTGEELIKQKELFLKHNATIPALAITGNTSVDDIRRYKKLGFSRVISKPYTSNELLEVINSVLEN